MDLAPTVFQIVKEQEKIIGPLAVELANGVDGLELTNLEKKEMKFKRDERLIVHDLVQTYAQFFGRTSIEICKDIIKKTVPAVTSEDINVMTTNVVA